jgi:DNA-binding NarL/FixJ family response regulator
MMAKLRILLADDHAVLREGLAMLINAQPDMEVVAQASNGREAVRLAKETAIDLAVLDISMPDLGGAQAAQQIRECCAHTRVLALTRHTETGYLRRLLEAGATGYVLKRSAADALIGAIRAVSQGRTYVEPSLAGAVLARAIATGSSKETRQARESLTLREEEVLRAIAWGRSNKEIAAELGISIKTVESYKAGAIEKLDLRTRGDIVRYAVARGWLSEDTAPQ